MYNLVRLFLLIHAGIHFTAFLRGRGKIAEKTFPVSVPKNEAWIWLLTALLFSGLAMAPRELVYCLVGFPAILFSQFLIVKHWKEARAGTLINILFLLPITVNVASWQFHRQFQRDISDLLSLHEESKILHEEDIQHLPKRVQRYLHFTHAIGNPVAHSFELGFEGKIRSAKDQPWMPLRSIQYNHFAGSRRFFFLNATMKGLSAAGNRRDGNKVLSLVYFPKFNKDNMFSPCYLLCLRGTPLLPLGTREFVFW